MIPDHRPKIDVVHTVENIIFNHIADLTEMLDQLRHLITLGTFFTAAGSTVLCKAARALEPGVAQGLMLDGCFAGREFALKGGSMGREDTLEKMLCRKEVVY